MDYLTRAGILKKDQVDGSLRRHAGQFVAAEGKVAQQGFGSAEPYIYENEIAGLGKPVKYQLINDAGWTELRRVDRHRSRRTHEVRRCFKKLVPIIQQSQVDYINDPAETNAIILDAGPAVQQRLGVQPGHGRLRGQDDDRPRPRRQRARQRRSATWSPDRSRRSSTSSGRRWRTVQRFDSQASRTVEGLAPGRHRLRGDRTTFYWDQEQLAVARPVLEAGPQRVSGRVPSSTWRRTSAPAASSAGSVCSAMLWHRPPALGTKIIHVGHIASSIWASWPAPAGIRRRQTEPRGGRLHQVDHRLGRRPPARSGPGLAVDDARPPARRQLVGTRSNSASASRRTASSVLRRSTVSVARPGTTLTRLGSAPCGRRCRPGAPPSSDRQLAHDAAIAGGDIARRRGASPSAWCRRGWPGRRSSAPARRCPARR